MAKPNNYPWDPNLALPDYVVSDPPGNRGAIGTGYTLPRGYYDSLVPYNDSYALPDYLEPPGNVARYSGQLQRGWIPGNVNLSLPGLGNGGGGLDLTNPPTWLLIGAVLFGAWFLFGKQ